MFIVCDGVDGAGKTTQSKKLFEYFSAQGKKALWTREPGGTPAAERIRVALLGACPEEEPSVVAELLLHSAARADHVEKVIRPALAEGKIVICDRFVDSTYAYQGAGQGTDERLIDAACALATGGLTPDLTFIFWLSGEEARRRMEMRDGGAPKNRYERQNVDFYARVGECYRRRARSAPHNVALIDASQDENSVFSDVLHRYEAACATISAPLLRAAQNLF
ncbi:MAG: dTMP kinase [Rickettsiales bacterium]